MSILSALKMQSNSIDDLAKLPQAMIMQMAQKKQIDKEMLAPILARKAEMMEAVSRSKALQQPANPSVMEQVMARNIQAENPANTVPQMPPQMPQMPQQMPQMAEAGVAQLPIPERQYAGGGIVAFARGDLIDLDAEDDDNDILAEYAEAMAAGERAMMTGSEQGMPQAQRMPTENTGIRYRDPIPAGASRGLEPDESGLARLRAQILQKESGGRRFDKDGKLLTSPKGAEGEMQVMPATARDPGFGIKPVQNNSPEELRRVGDEYAGVLLNKYKDPIVAMIAYNMGPGATDKWLAAGADPKKLPKETQGYIRGVTLAEGGEVQRFTDGGSTGFQEDIDYFGDYLGRKKARLGESLDELNPIPELSKDIRNYFTKPRIKSTDKDKLEEIARGQGVFPEGSKALPGNMPLTVDPADLPPQFNFPPQGGIGPTDAELGRNAVTQAPVEKKSRLDAFMDRINAGDEDLAAQRKQDKNMALLAAGLGMLGGTSQYAFENVGKGGLAGVQYLSEANKQRAAEKAALDKAQVTAMRYQDLADIAKGNQAGLLAVKEGQLEVNRQTLTLNQQKALSDNLTKIEKSAEASAATWIKSNPLAGFNLEKPEDVQAIKDRILAQNNRYQSIYRQLEGENFVVPTMSGTATSSKMAQADKIIGGK